MIDINKIDFEKGEGLVPVIVQDNTTSKVLMLAYMNKESLSKTIESGKACFYSRSREELWLKGETSGNYLNLKSIQFDCDADSLLVKVQPEGPACHTGNYSCFEREEETTDLNFLKELQTLLYQRKKQMPEGSYTSSLFKKGINKIAQKLGEEAIELVIEAKDDNKDLFLNEAADLLYHLSVLLVQKGYRYEEIVEVLRARRA